MNDTKNNNSSSFENSSQSHSQVEYSFERKIETLNRVIDEGTFYEVFEHVKEKIDFDCFDKSEQEDVESICLIITEVLKLPPAAMIRISGNNLPAEMVQAIYHRLGHGHIELVIENYARATYEIKFKKTYLRTALYNSVFEIRAHYTNAVAKDLPQYVKNPFGRSCEK